MPAKAVVKAKRRHKKNNGGMDGMQKRLAAARESKYRVKVGITSGSADYPDGTSVTMVAIIHEFGSEDGRIPERSFLRSAMRDKADEHREFGRKLALAVSNGRRDPKEALDLLGTKAAANARQQAVDLSSPANAVSTVRRKGSSNPLLDTEHMIGEITHEVIE